MIIWLSQLILSATSSPDVLRTTLSGDSNYLPHLLPNVWEDLGHVDPTSTRVSLTIALALADGAVQKLEKEVAAVSRPDSARYAQYLSRSQVAGIVRPAPATMRAVLDWLNEETTGALAVRETFFGDYLFAELAAADAEALLGTTLHRYRHVERGVTIVRAAEYSVPSSLAGTAIRWISGVTGAPSTLHATVREHGGHGRRLHAVDEVERQDDENDNKRAALEPSSGAVVYHSIAWTGSTLALLATLRCADGFSYATETGTCPDGNDIVSLAVDASALDASSGETLHSTFTVPRAGLSTRCQRCETFTGPAEFKGVVLSSACSLLGNVSCFFALPGIGIGYNTTLSVVATYGDGGTSEDAVCYPGASFMGCQLSRVAQDEVTPSTIKTLYDVTVPAGFKPSAESGVGANRQAVAEFLEEYYSEVDLAGWLVTYNVAQPVGVRNVALVCGGEFSILVNTSNGERVNTSCNDPAVAGGEATLDVQTMIGVAPGIATEYWSFGGRRDNTAEPSEYNQEPFLLYMLTLNNKEDGMFPFVHSFSYDDAEFQMEPTYMDALDVEFQKAALRGVSLLFAAGDDGASGGQLVNNTLDCTRFYPDWPSTSRYVTSVGGTAYGRDANDALVEVVSDAATGSRISTGGGFSNYHPTADYQQAHVAAYLAAIEGEVPSSLFNATGRGYPDISGIATNFQITLQGKLVPIAGTSASTPLVSGLITLLNELRLQRGDAPLGFLNPALYSLSNSCPECFVDIVQGDNRCTASGPSTLATSGCCENGFPAKAGWDAATGLGTLRWRAAAEALAGVAPAASNAATGTVVEITSGGWVGIVFGFLAVVAISMLAGVAGGFVLSRLLAQRATRIAAGKVDAPFPSSFHDPLDPAALAAAPTSSSTSSYGALTGGDDAGGVSRGTMNPATGAAAATATATHPRESFEVER